MPVRKEYNRNPLDLKPNKAIGVQLPLGGDPLFKLSYTTEEQAISNLKNLILTRKGERPFQPQLGCGIQNVLFEPLDYASGALIRSEIIDTLRRYEPRINVNTVVCTPDYMNNGYSVELTYSIIGRDDGTPIAVEFFLERTR